MRSMTERLLIRVGQAALATAAVALLATAAIASDGLDRVPGFYRTSWLPDERSPVDIRALAQTNDGYLWVGGRTGLYRFDGVRFERFEPPLDPALPAQVVTALATDGKDGLWIAMAGGHTLKLRDNRFEQVATLGDGVGPVVRFLAAESTQPYALTNDGLFQLEAGTWRPLRVFDAAEDNRHYDAWLDARETLWVATATGIHVRDAGQEGFRKVTDRAAGYGRFSASRDGDLWFCGEIEGLVKVAPGPLHRPGGGGTCHQFFIDSRDEAWIGAANGAGRAPLAALEQDPGATFANLAKDAFGEGAIAKAFVEDNEGNIWVGTSQGLRQFRRNRLQEPDSPGGSGGVAPAGDDGIWLISHARGLIHVGATTTSYPEAGTRLTHIARGHDGILWVGGQRRGELLRIEGKTISAVPFPPGEEDVYVNAIGSGTEASLWVSTQPSPKGQIYRRSGDTWVPRGGVGGLPESPATSVMVDARDRAWIGYADSRVYMVDGMQTTLFDTSDGLDVGIVRTVVHRGNATYVGGDDGIFVMTRSSFRPLPLRRPHRALGVVDMLFTQQGDLWINQAGSVLRLPATELARLEADAAHEVQAESFDSRDGRKGSPVAYAPLPSLAETDNGTLWIAGANLTTVVPTAITRNQRAPAVDLVFVDINGVRARPATSVISVPPGDNEVGFGYTALSLTMPERVQFKYQLEGYDPRWREGGMERSVSYSNLPPGDYRFRVIASNNDGVWNETGASANLQVHPAYHQTTWFRIGTALTVMLSAAWAVRARVRFVATRIKDRMRERSRERERIARELHDTLLQGIQGLILHFQSVADDIPMQDPNRSQMEKALDRADKMMGEARERVSDLRLQQEGASLGLSLKRHLVELEPKEDVLVRVRETGTTHDLVAIVRIEILRIVHEAIANALQHSRPKRLRIIVLYGPRSLRVRVRDDGCGLREPAAAARPGHWGLRGMQERANGIGAQLCISAAKGDGTTVDLRVPVSIAYADHQVPLRIRMAELVRRLWSRRAS